MTFPSFFSEVAPIVVHDRLAAFLGTAAAGVIEFRYADVVKLAGHSCPTVAGAYLMTRRALAALYPDELPERGEIVVEFREAQDIDSTGVTASVIGMLTGAASSSGFKGIAGHFVRHSLLSFDELDLPGEVAFRRRDTGQRICATFCPQQVPADDRLEPILRNLLAGRHDPVAAEVFATLWQDRVRRMLIDHADDPRLVRLVT